MKDKDFLYFVHLLFEFNSSNFNPHASRARNAQMVNLRGSPLVQLHGWVLMKNHYHLLLSNTSEAVDGISKFLMRVNVGYAKYYNLKYKRTGYVFKGRTKKVPIKTDAHALYILHYIHFNPLDYSKHKNWRLRDGGVLLSATQALSVLNRYRWSSYRDYVGVKNFPSLLSTDFMNALLGNYTQSAKRFLRDLESSSHKELEY